MNNLHGAAAPAGEGDTPVSRAISLCRQGAHQQAIDVLRPLADGNCRDTHFFLGEAHAGLGRWSEAVPHYGRAAQISPDDVPALFGLGNALFSSRRQADAVIPLRQARLLRPTDVQINYLLGTSLLGTAHEQEALDCLEIAYRGSDNERIANNYAIALDRLARYDEAIDVLLKLLNRRPGYARGWDTLGSIYTFLKRFEEGKSAFERAIELDPNDPQPYVNIVNCLVIYGQADEVGTYLQRAVERGADSVDLLYRVAGQFDRLQMPDAAMAIYRHVLKIDPSHIEASSRVLHLGLESCEWQSYDTLVSDTLAHIEDDIASGRPLRYVLFNLFALPVDNDLILRAARHQASCTASRVEAGGAAPFVHRLHRRSRIRLGYALPYTHFSSMPLVMRDLVENHDRDRFEVYGYTLEPPLDEEFSHRFRGAFDAIVDVPESSPRTAARMVHDDRIDILVDVTGHTPTSCLPIMACRPAPVQVHAVGYSLTCGADYIDYLVSDPRFIPEAWADRCHEALAYLPDIFIPSFAKPTATMAVDRRRYGLDEAGTVFVNFNDSYKFDPVMFACWMRILTRVPDSILWLGKWSTVAVRNLKRTAAEAGVAPDRLVFADVVRHEEHAARLELADIALDNQYHGGGVSSTDALSAGLLLVTLRGTTPAGRLGTTLCTAAGVGELITDDLAGYEELAVALALDPARRGGLRQRLREGRETSPLFDRRRYRRHLEEAYAIMWQRHLDGLPPATFHVPA